ncbi:hypothetical protein WJX73_006923 [Symbiochloris irregularis]|uniref:SEC7 domain-containing protein n=1 Tax=Symbiochloris irregularis TaxID=706552 RepID=A0AAW1Q0W4_9CHLO
MKGKTSSDIPQGKQPNGIGRRPSTEPLRDSAASLAPLPGLPRRNSLHRPTPIPATVISGRASINSIQSLPSIRDEDDMDEEGYGNDRQDDFAATERQIVEQRPPAGLRRIATNEHKASQEPGPDLSPLNSLPDSPAAEAVYMEETLLGPSHRGSSLNLDSEVGSHHSTALMAAMGWRDPSKSLPNGSDDRRQSASDAVLHPSTSNRENNAHRERNLADSATDREGLPKATSRAKQELGPDVASTRTTPDGKGESLADVSLDISPEASSETMPNPLHSHKSMELRARERKMREVSERDLRAVARFLRSPGLSRQVIGDLLGENCEHCKRLLVVFASTFEFRGETFEAALREYLDAFRLPGESQKIDRVLEAFSVRYWSQNVHSTLFRSADAVHVLAFSVVLLNTDLHNNTVKKKMSMESYVHNNRGINDNEDFPREFLEELYTSISCKGFRIPPSSQPLQPNSPPQRTLTSRMSWPGSISHKSPKSPVAAASSRKVKQSEPKPPKISEEGPSKPSRCCWPFSCCSSGSK